MRRSAHVLCPVWYHTQQQEELAPQESSAARNMVRPLPGWHTMAHDVSDTAHPHLLLADDDTVLSDLLATFLLREGFRITQVFDGEAAVTHALAEPYALIVLDVMLPQRDGFDVLRTLRAQVQTPVIMLTARGDDIDRILGLEMGADDYVPKPFNPRELLARIRAILRRSAAGGDTPQEPQTITLGDLVLCTSDRSVRVNGEPIALTSTEFSVLALLLGRSGQIVSKEELSLAALGRKLGPYDRSLDMHVSNLRKKLGSLPNGDTRLKTVRGVGYLYVRNRDDASCAASS